MSQVLDASSRRAFVERLSALSGFAVLAGCAGQSASIPSAQTKAAGSPNDIHHFVDARTGAANVVSIGVTLSTVTNGNTVSLSSTDASGVTTVLMTASLDPGSSAISFFSRGNGVYQNNINQLLAAPPTTLPVLGHTVTSVPSSPTTSTISGPVVSNGSATLSASSDTGTASGTYEGVTQSRIFTSPTAGTGCHPVCRNSPPRTAQLSADQIISGILAGIAFVAGLLSLIFFLPEMAVGAVVLAVIDVLASFADLVWNLITL